MFIDVDKAIHRANAVWKQDPETGNIRIISKNQASPLSLAEQDAIRQIYEEEGFLGTVEFITDEPVQKYAIYYSYGDHNDMAYTGYIKYTEADARRLCRELDAKVDTTIGHHVYTRVK